MSKIIVSIHTKKNIGAAVFLRDGRMINKMVKTLPSEEIAKSTYLSLLNAMYSSMSMLKTIVESDMDNISVVFEINNGTVVKWVEEGTSPDTCSEALYMFLKALDEIPCSYSFTHSKKPIAVRYATEKYLDKPKLSGVEDLMAVFDVEE